MKSLSLKMSSRRQPVSSLSVFPAGSILFLSIALASCEKEQQKSVLPSIDFNTENVYFLTSDYKSDTSYLYSFNPTDKTTHEESLSLFSGDVAGFVATDSMGSTTNLYVAEKFSNFGLPTRVTQYDSQGNQTQNSKNLPVNLRDIIRYQNTLVFAGYDNKEIAQTNLALDKIYLHKTTVSTFFPGADADSFVSLLKSSNNQVFALSIGYKHPNLFPGAQIYALDRTFVGAELGHWLVQDQGEVCSDLYDSLKLSPSKILVACNPAYAKTGQNLDLFYIDASSGTPTIRLVLSKKTKDATQKFTLGGLSANGKFAFVTEDDGDFLNPTVQAAYWLDPNDLENSHAVLNAAYFVTYHKPSDSYVFSCSLNAQKECEDKRFAVAKATQDGYTHETPQGFSVDYIASQVQFLKPVF